MFLVVSKCFHNVSLNEMRTEKETVTERENKEEKTDILFSLLSLRLGLQCLPRPVCPKT